MLQLEESRITQLLKETIKVICRSADNCSEIAVKGLLGITLDRKEIFLVQIDDVIDMALERTGTAFHASDGNGSSVPQGSFNPTAELRQSRHDLNLTIGSADGRALNNTTIPENHTARQTSDDISAADSAANQRFMQEQGQKDKKDAIAKGSDSRSCHSGVRRPQDCRNATVVLTSDIAVPQTMSATTAGISNSSRGRGRGQLRRGRGQYGIGRGQYGIGRGQLGGRRQYGRGRGHRGGGRGKRSVISSFLHEDVSLSGGRRTRSSFVSETHRTVISSFRDTIDNYSQCSENLDSGNGSQTLGTIQRAEHTTLKTLKQPAFKRKLKPLGLTSPKKSKHSESGVLVMHPQASSIELPLNRCSVCKRVFSKLTDLAEHYTTEHSINRTTGLSPSYALKAAPYEAAEPVKCASPSCRRTFPTARGMLQHCGRTHNRGRGQFRPTGVCAGRGRNHHPRFDILSNADEKPAAGSVVGQIIPSLLFQHGVYANVHAHNLPHTVTGEDGGTAEKDSTTPLSSSVIVKQEIDAIVYTDQTV